MKKISVSITGLGYVGLQVALAFSKKFYTVGYDINLNRVKQLNKNIDITNEVSSKILKKSSLVYTNNKNELKSSNFHIIAVPTPITKNNKPDLRIIKEASKTIAKIIKYGDIIVYESTVYPGLTEEICIPILEKYSKLKNSSDFHVGYSPERINPGDKIYTFEKIDKIVSAQSEYALKVIDYVYSRVTKGKIYKASNIKVAEAAKIIENTQRDINAALINEFSKIFRKMNINTNEVLEAASTKWNFLNFKPGLVGGHCIGVDPFYLTHKAIQSGYKPKLILSGRSINDGMGYYIAKTALSYFKPTKKLTINIFGITFKENCSDIRNSKVFDLIYYLKKYNHNINLYDPYVKSIKIFGKVYKTKKLNNLKKSHILFVCVAHNEFVKLKSEKFLENKLYKNGLLFDVKSIYKKLKNNKNITYLSL